jgi:hypothetical protein
LNGVNAALTSEFQHPTGHLAAIPRQLGLRASFDFPTRIRGLYEPDRVSPDLADNLYSEFVLLSISITPNLSDIVRTDAMGAQGLES